MRELRSFTVELDQDGQRVFLDLTELEEDLVEVDFSDKPGWRTSRWGKLYEGLPILKLQGTIRSAVPLRPGANWDFAWRCEGPELTGWLRLRALSEDRLSGEVRSNGKYELGSEIGAKKVIGGNAV